MSHASMSVTVIEPGVPSIEELAQVANGEHQNVVRITEGFVSDVLSHAIKCGEAISQLHERIPYGEWKSWREQNLEMTVSLTNYYERLWFYRESLPDELFSRRLTQGGQVRDPARYSALPYLRGLPDIRNVKSAERRREARHLHRRGANYGEVASILGISTETARCWVDPAAAERNRVRVREAYRQKIRARRALAEQDKRRERDALAKSASRDDAKTYSLIRQAIQLADRNHLADVWKHLDRAETAITKHMREQRV